MNFPLMIDATFLTQWSDCREMNRLSYVQELQPATPNIHFKFGEGIHSAVEVFWKGGDNCQAYDSACDIFNQMQTKKLNLKETEDWMKLVDQAPSMIDLYIEKNERNPEKILMIEQEWSFQYSDDVILCGKTDRVMNEPSGIVLYDLKTATAWGKEWESEYIRDKMLKIQFGLYDWWLCKIGKTPAKCRLDVLIKGNAKYNKPVDYRVMDLSYVTTEAYRARFRQQLAWKVSEIVHYFKNYREQSPWPMSGGSACKTVYGECDFLPSCLWGNIPKVTELYQIRQEHLEIRK